MTDQRPMSATLTCDEVRDLAAGFVLDALQPDEMSAVRAHLASCDDAHAEMIELATALPVLDANVPQVTPPASLGTRIRAAAEADLEARAADDVVALPVAAPTPVVVASAVAPTSRGPRIASWALGIAAVLAIALLGGWNLVLQAQLSDAQAYTAQVSTVTALASQPGALTVVLGSEGDGPSGLAALGPNGELAMAMQSMPATSGSQVYEAWAIVGDAAPVPLGSFQVGGTGTGTFAADGLAGEPGVVLALTLEPGPGATAPTLPIVASGTATAG